jgi:glutamyl-tRNA synthetase
MPDVLRFAPSPTGALHVGGVRTALLNWLHARRYGGKFLLRIEDTDQERSDQKSVDVILNGFRWVGIDFDGEPVFQSRNVERHRQCVRKLLETGHAYTCYCPQEVLEEKRQRAMAEKRQPQYDGTCRDLTPAQRADLEAKGIPHVVRLRVPEGETVWDDPVRGECRWSNERVDDLILMRSNGWPIYNLAVVVDDHDTGVTLVMRGPEHISNTPKQVLIARALGFDPPKFVHFSLILGPDKKKLSKRHGATAITEYRDRGYLPQAVLNFLALLGWSPSDGREKLTLREMIDAYSVEGINTKDAVFDEQKLEWLNSQHLNDLSLDQLLNEIAPFWIKAGLISEADLAGRRPYLERVVALLRERCRLLTDFVEKGRYFFEEPVAYEEAARKKHWSNPEAADRLTALADRFEAVEAFDAASAENGLRALSESLGLSPANLIHPARLAVSGTSGGPGLFEMLEALGRETVVRRLRRSAELL